MTIPPKLYAFLTILALGSSSSFAFVQSRRFARTLQQQTKYIAAPCAFRTGPVLKYSERGVIGIPSNSTTTTLLQEDARDSTTTTLLQEDARERFDKTAASTTEVNEDVILTFENKPYNLTSYAKAHPGGHKILQKFHNRDMTTAFHKVGHSRAAYELLSDFLIEEDEKDGSKAEDLDAVSASTAKYTKPSTQRWRLKLFTHEDPIGFHKYLGVYCLLHFVFRIGQMMFQDPSSGFGTRLGKGHSLIPIFCVLPHALLSLSSLIFHTVPRERVVGKPMIWQEFRAHNILFGLRSITSTILWSFAIRYKEFPGYRRFTVIAVCFTALLAQVGADIATHLLRANSKESTTATMPYWDGCSIETQKRFKGFYAISQFIATIGCIGFSTPAASFLVLLPIQIASLLMTLVRKGLLSSKGYHLIYTGSLVLPYFITMRWAWCVRAPVYIGMPFLGYLMYKARRRGVNKYALWLPIYATCIFGPQKFLYDYAW